MDTQNQNQPQPNYDFIMNPDGGASAPVQQPPTNSRRKLFLIGGGLLIFILLVVAAIVASVQTGVQSSQTAEDFVKSYIANISEENYDAAYSQVLTTTSLNKEIFVEQSAKGLRNLVKLETCVVGESASLNEVTTVKLSCKTKVDKDLPLLIEIVSNEGQLKIKGMTYEGA